MLDLHFTDEECSDAIADEINDWVDDVSQEFAESRYFNELNDTEREAYDFILVMFFDCCYTFCLVGPDKVDKKVIQDVLCNVIPREVAAGQNVFEAFAPVMTRFLRWCEEEDYMTSTQPIIDEIEKLAPEMISRCQNPANWGPGKALLMEPHYVEDNDWEESSLPEPVTTYTRPQEKIGRNEPCFCGSGKKYKKCCLNL